MDGGMGGEGGAGGGAAAARREWSDWLHPCLVLEIRREMRTSLFAALFLGVPLLMFEGYLLHEIFPDIEILFEPYMYGYNNYDTNSYIYYLDGQLWWLHWGWRCLWYDIYISNFYVDIRGGIGFWLSAKTLFLLVLPSMSLFAMRTEISNRALELLLMTRQGLFGVVMGKWLVKTLTAMLLACAFLPYIITRYYLIGMNPLYEASWLAGLVVISSLMCGVAVALSVIRYVWIRLVLIGLLYYACNYVIGAYYVVPQLAYAVITNNNKCTSAGLMVETLFLVAMLIMLFILLVLFPLCLRDILRKPAVIRILLR